MVTKREGLLGLVLFGGALAMVLVPTVSRVDATRSASQSEEAVPAHHTQPPPGELPSTLDPSRFDDPVVKNSYALAAKVKKVLYQQPCYCHCDRSQGHGSLLDCFTSTHGSMCNICMGEALYSYEQTRKGKTPAQIRAGIEKGEWQQIDATKYQTYPAKP
jgi:hypothetical protein